MSLSNFEVLNKLGDGAYSTVYKVKRIADGNVYALKKVKMQTLNKKEKKNALNEVRILASIHHPNIISYKEAFFDDSGNLCLIMEYADSGDLYQKISKYQKRGKYLSEHFIWTTFVQITKGLQALHDLNILHRDMKSANVFLNIDGTAKLGDMNVSKVAKDGLLHTQTGTPYYASPEVWQDKPYNIKSDIWSLGCVLYEAATLKPPFRADDMQGLYEKVIKGEFSPIQTHFSKDLRFVLRQLLQIEPSKRPTCEQLFRMPAVQRHLINSPEQNEQNILLSPIKIPENQVLTSETLPKSNYTSLSKSDVPYLKQSPSKAIKWNNKSLGINNNSYSPDYIKNYKYHKDAIKDSYAALKLPGLKHPGKASPQPIRKIRELEEYFSMPKSLPASDRLRKLREAYISRPIKLLIR
jgi:NIMA (never in mitosis gene a)-related kinase 1/4/5